MGEENWARLATKNGRNGWKVREFWGYLVSKNIQVSEKHYWKPYMSSLWIFHG